MTRPWWRVGVFAVCLAQYFICRGYGMPRKEAAGVTGAYVRMRMHPGRIVTAQAVTEWRG